MRFAGPKEGIVVAERPYNVPFDRNAVEGEAYLVGIPRAAIDHVRPVGKPQRAPIGTERQARCVNDIERRRVKGRYSAYLIDDMDGIACPDQNHGGAPVFTWTIAAATQTPYERSVGIEDERGLAAGLRCDYVKTPVRVPSHGVWAASKGADLPPEIVVWWAAIDRAPLCLDDAVDLDEIVVCLPVIQEVLQGFREERAYHAIRHDLEVLHRDRDSLMGCSGCLDFCVQRYGDRLQYRKTVRYSCRWSRCLPSSKS